MGKGAPKKQFQCIWHEEARVLRAEGWTYQNIADKFGVTAAAVYFVINPDRRAEYAMRKGAKEKTLAPRPVPA
jgi:predicted transcriptional regulator